MTRGFTEAFSARRLEATEAGLVRGEVPLFAMDDSRVLAVSCGKS